MTWSVEASALSSSRQTGHSLASPTLNSRRDFALPAGRMHSVHLDVDCMMYACRVNPDSHALATFT